MTIKATKNCVENLIAKGIGASSIAVLIPTVVLDTAHLQGIEVDCVKLIYRVQVLRIGLRVLCNIWM